MLVIVRIDGIKVLPDATDESVAKRKKYDDWLDGQVKTMFRAISETGLKAEVTGYDGELHKEEKVPGLSFRISLKDIVSEDQQQQAALRRLEPVITKVADSFSLAPGHKIRRIRIDAFESEHIARHGVLR